MTSQARLVGGRYEEGEPLGRGGMAEVRRGIDNRLGRAVAIKRLRVDLASDSTFQARFRREAQSAASLNHPTIVSVYDTGEEPDPNGSGITIPYIVMELVTGKTLRDLIREGRKIMPERALEITSGVLEALDYSHRAGIVHRDIKPGNVMLTPQGQVKVMDFGIARAVADTTSDMTQTAAVIGTAQYLSPEQARGETVDARSDLYSTGCLLYELLTGRPPFVGESPVSVAYQHVREQPLPPSSFDPDIPPEVDAVVLKALVKNRDERYQSANEMRQDLHRVLAGQQVTAPMAAFSETRAMAPTAVAPAAATQAFRQTGDDLLPPGDDDELDSRARRNRGLAYFLLGLAIVAVAIGAYALINNLNGDSGNNAGGGQTSAPVANKVQVPDVSNMTASQAEAALTAAKLKFAQGSSAPSETVDRGKAISSTPAAGSEAEENSTVTVVFSTASRRSRYRRWSTCPRTRPGRRSRACPATSRSPRRPSNRTPRRRPGSSWPSARTRTRSTPQGRRSRSRSRPARSRSRCRTWSTSRPRRRWPSSRSSVSWPARSGARTRTPRRPPCSRRASSRGRRRRRAPRSR